MLLHSIIDGAYSVKSFGFDCFWNAAQFSWRKSVESPTFFAANSSKWHQTLWMKDTFELTGNTRYNARIPVEW